jgi:hypothetical protein
MTETRPEEAVQLRLAMGRLMASMKWVEDRLETLGRLVKDEYDESTCRALREILRHARNQTQREIREGGVSGVNRLL